MENLIIENPTKLTDTSFKITINGKDFEYEISDDKNIDSVIEKLNTWIDRGEDSFGGLYDYIKNTFKLVGEYEEPVEDLEDDIDLDVESDIEIPSDTIDINEPVDPQLEIDINIDDKESTIQINDWNATFTIIDDLDNFTDMLTKNVNEDMSLNERTDLIVGLIRSLEATDSVDFYNLINLVLNTGVDITNTFEDLDSEDTTSFEAGSDSEINQDNEIDTNSPNFESVNVSESKEILDEEIDTVTYSPVNELGTDPEELSLDQLITNEDFLNDLVKLDLSLFELKNKEGEIIYFIGGINNVGNKFSLSYTTKPPIELDGSFDSLKDKEECLNNIEDLNMVVDYINKLLNIVYNKKLADMEDGNE